MKISQVAVRTATTALAFAVAMSLVSPGALAQSPAPSQQELNPAARVPEQQGGTAARGDLLSPPEPGPCVFKEPGKDSAPFALTGVEFTGADQISPADLEAAYAGYVGKQVRASSLCDIRDRAASILFRKGILARVEIPAQTIKGGLITLEVIAAYVAGVDVHGDVGPARSKDAQYIEMLRGMRPFDINKAQRYLFLASDVPGIHIAATLKPSPRGRGAITLDISVTREAWNALVNVQNLGSEETGPFGALARVDFNSFTELGDRTTLVAYSTFELSEQTVIQGIEEIRLGSEGLLARLSVAWGMTRPGASLAVLGINGRSLVAEAGLSYPVIRSRRLNLNVGGGLDIIMQNVNVASIVPLTRDNLRVATLNANGSYAWRDGIPGSAGLGIELRHGLDILGASHAGDLLNSRVQGRPDAFVLRSDGQLTLNWLPYLSTYVGFSAQYADHPLLAYEELAVGNLTIGRGYDPSVISGDRGAEGTFELRLGQFPIYRRITVGILGFYDIAAIENLDTGGLNRTLHSVGGGLKFQIGPHIHLDLTYAHPLSKITPFAVAPPDDSVLVSLTVGL